MRRVEYPDPKLLEKIIETSQRIAQIVYYIYKNLDEKMLDKVAYTYLKEDITTYDVYARMSPQAKRALVAGLILTHTVTTGIASLVGRVDHPFVKSLTFIHAACQLKQFAVQENIEDLTVLEIFNLVLHALSSEGSEEI